MNDTCYNMGKPWKYCVKWKKSNTKEQILYVKRYIKCIVLHKMSRTDKSIEAKSHISDCLGREGWEDWRKIGSYC